MTYVEEVELWTRDPVVKKLGDGTLTLTKGMPVFIMDQDWVELAPHTPLTFPNIWSLMPPKGEPKGKLLQYWECIQGVYEWVSKRECGIT